MSISNYLVILAISLVAIATPGPATLAIANASMSLGRKHGFITASGVLSGSLVWSLTSAISFITMISIHPSILAYLKYFGAAYLALLSYKSFISARSNSSFKNQTVNAKSVWSCYMKGLLIHLTNPKAILFFTALYAIAVPQTASMFNILLLVLMIATVSVLGFFGFAYLFSIHFFVATYAKLKSLIEILCSVFFGGASVSLLTAQIEP